MNQQNLSIATKSLIETGRKSFAHAVQSGRVTMQDTLRTSDEMFKSTADTLACAPVLAVSKLRDELVSVEGQLSLIAGIVAHGVADRTEQAANLAALSATNAIDGFETMFDKRVRDSIDRLGLPGVDLLVALADRVASLTRRIEELVAATQAVKVAAPARRKAAKTAKRKSVRRA